MRYNNIDWRVDMTPYKNREAVIRKTYENLCRRQAARLGLKLSKSRAKLPHINNLGEYIIIDRLTGAILAGERYELTLESAKAFLDQYEEKIISEKI